jgi:hypothetical protein
VITGFNTDIEFSGVTYHVQTEDKGLERPVIMSLVYDGGTILASKRASYEDLIESGFDEDLLTERLKRQHRLICAAIKAGRIDDLTKMAGLETGATDSGSAQAVDGAAMKGLRIGPVSILATPSPGLREIEIPIPKPQFDNISCPEPELELDVIGIIEDSMVVPLDAVEMVSELAGLDRPVNNKLSIEIVGDTSFKGGEHKSVTFMVRRGSQNKVIPDAHIMVKILGSTFRPLIFNSTTDNNGVSTVTFQIPSFSSGRSELLVRAMSDGEEIELRRPIATG